MTQTNNNSHTQGGRYASTSPVMGRITGNELGNDASGGAGRAKASPAKLKGNKVHQRLKMLALDWMKVHMPERVERLRKRARQIEERKAAGK